MKRCRELDVEENVCIDEQIVPFKGQLDIKQYMQNKPCKWAVKVFLLCGSSGLVYDGLVYQGKMNHLNEELVDTYGVTGAIVVQLSQRLASQVHHKLYADNYFTSSDTSQLKEFVTQVQCDRTVLWVVHCRQPRRWSELRSRKLLLLKAMSLLHSG